MTFVAKDAAHYTLRMIRQPGPPSPLEQALQHHQAGRLREAEAFYRQVLSAQPTNSDALNLLGVLHHQTGRNDEAIQLIDQSIAINPQSPIYFNNQGLVLIALQRFEDAKAAYSRAVALKPDYADALYSLAWLLQQKEEFEEALAAYGRVLQLRSDYLNAYNNAGNILIRLGRLDEAVATFQQAISVRPDFADVHINLGTALREQGNADESLAAYERGVALKPDSSEAHNNLANALQSLGRTDEAVSAYRRAVALQPNNTDALHNLAIALLDLDEIDQSIAVSEQAIRLNPKLGGAYNSLANGLKAAGRLDEAIAALRTAGSLTNEPYVQTNLMLSITFHPDYGPKQIYDEHVRWNERFAKQLAPLHPTYPNDRTAGRKIKVGYVASYFRDHCQSFFTLPLLSHHDHERFEIYCYADVARPDEITSRIRDHADHWRDVSGMSNEDLVETVRNDQIDILVDLALHMEGGHLLAFARKPAPIQVTWLGYPGTTGLSTMDYRFSDPLIDPGFDDAFYSEKTVRLPESFWCYDPLTTQPTVNDLPALSNGFITFGSLNNFTKVTDRTIGIWANLLRATPNARLHLLAPQGSARHRAARLFSEQGIDASRIEFIPWQPRQDYLQTYHQIDIGLDPFPCPGHTTTMDALWMGVPVINLPGSTAVSRGGKSILTNVGLPELIAASELHYIKIATDLAADINRLSELRRSLRKRMETSPLMNATRFTKDVEAAFTTMWQTWRVS